MKYRMMTGTQSLPSKGIKEHDKYKIAMITSILCRQENCVKAFSKQVEYVTCVCTHILRSMFVVWTLEDFILMGVKEIQEKQMKEEEGSIPLQFL